MVPESATASDLSLARQLIAELSDRYGVPLPVRAVALAARGDLLPSAKGPPGVWWWEGDFATGMVWPP